MARLIPLRVWFIQHKEIFIPYVARFIRHRAWFIPIWQNLFHTGCGLFLAGRNLPRAWKGVFYTGCSLFQGLFHTGYNFIHSVVYLTYIVPYPMHKACALHTHTTTGNLKYGIAVQSIVNCSFPRSQRVFLAIIPEQA